MIKYISQIVVISLGLCFSSWIFAAGLGEKTQIVSGYRIAQQPNVQRQIPVKTVKHIIVIGSLDVYLVAEKSRHPVITIAGDPALSNAVKVLQDENGTVFVDLPVADESNQSNPAPTAERVRVTIPVNQLEIVDVAGDANLTMHDVITRHLSLISRGSGKINMKGMINLVDVLQLGSSNISASWVKADTLKVRLAQNGQLHLSGAVNLLDAKLINDAKLDGRYLRANKVLISSSGSSQASVIARSSLSAFANDNSNIYYYNQPKHLSELTKNNANVLQLAHSK